MNIEKIKRSNTKYLGKNIIYYQEIQSTQDEIKKEAEKHIQNGTLIITDKQTSGKGTKGRKWISEEEKNITMSFVVYPKCNIEQIENITIKMAKAIIDAIYQLYGYQLTIKQPNDVLFNGKKICGILTQSTIIQEKINYIIVGIGFNVNQEKFPLELEDIATSLKKETGKEFEREEIINKILENIEKFFLNIMLQ